MFHTFFLYQVFNIWCVFYFIVFFLGSHMCEVLVPRLGGPRLGSPPLGVYFKTAHFGPATLPVPSGHLRLVATFEEGESKSSDKWFCVFFLYDTVRPE